MQKNKSMERDEAREVSVCQAVWGLMGLLKEFCLYFINNGKSLVGFKQGVI